MKIRRFIITTLVLIAFSSGGWSDSTGTRTSTANMLIKAFKVDSSNAEPELVITDALVSNLDQIPDGHEINLTDYVSKFLGSTSSNRTDFNSGVVFSYRVAGAKEGSYTLSFEFNSSLINLMHLKIPSRSRSGSFLGSCSYSKWILFLHLPFRILQSHGYVYL